MKISNYSGPAFAKCQNIHLATAVCEELSEEFSESSIRITGILLAEKDEEGVSTLYSLTDFVDEDGTRIRKDESNSRCRNWVTI